PMPAAEGSEQPGDLRPVLQRRARTGHRDRRADLLDVARAAGALVEMCLEAGAVIRRERAVEVVRDELDELVAGEVLHRLESAREPGRYNPSRPASQETWRARSA